MLFFFICAAFVLFPEKVISGAGSGLSLCLNAVIPSLLPFMVLSGCVIKSHFARPLGALLSKILTPLTGISGPGCVCFLCGLVGGYGAGAKAVSESYRENLITKKEAESLLVFCNNAGPLFVIGTVGVGFYGSESVGVMLFLVQVLTAIIAAKVFSGNMGRYLQIREEWSFYKKNKPHTGELVVKNAIESGSAIINACVFVILFSAILEVIPFGEYGFLSGILEVTRGVSEMSRKGDTALNMTSAFLAWGGVSVHFQADALCKGELSLIKYYAGKGFCAVCAYLITKASGGDVATILAMYVIMLALFAVWNIVIKPVKRALPRQPLFRQRRHS